MLTTAERKPFTTETKSAKESGWLNVMSFNALSSALETASKWFKTRHKLWDSTSYFVDLHPTSTPEKILAKKNELNFDLITLWDEHAAYKGKKIYPYSKFGILGGYTDLISTRCQNHELQLSAQGLKVTRAQLETNAAQNLEYWFDNPAVQVGDAFLQVSPRGQVDEGYPGIAPENYVFINFYQKIGLNQFHLVQYISFDNETALKDLITSIRRDFNGTQYNPVPASTKPENLSHQIITQQTWLPAGFSFKKLEAEYLYKNEKNWARKRKDLPELNEQEYSLQIARALDVCLSQFEALVLAGDSNNIADFNLLVDMVTEVMRAWVANHALNYHDKTKFSKSTQNIFDPVTEKDKQAQKTPTQIAVELWQARLAKKAGQTLNTDQKNQLNTLKTITAISATNPLNDLVSFAHCIVGTPQSLINPTQSLQSLAKSINYDGMRAATFSLAEQLALKEKLKNLTKIDVLNKQTGRHEVYYLELVDSQYEKDYQTGCYKDIDPETGELALFGPCHVRLDQDGLIVPNSIITELEYDQLQQNLSLLELETSLEENAALNANPEQQKQARQLTQKLTQKLLKKSINLSELLNGDIIDTRQAVTFQLAQLAITLKHASDPLDTLVSFVNQVTQEMGLQESNQDQLPAQKKPIPFTHNFSVFTQPTLALAA